MPIKIKKPNQICLEAATPLRHIYFVTRRPELIPCNLRKTFEKNIEFSGSLIYRFYNTK